MTQKLPLTELGVRRGLSSSWGPEMVALNPRLNPSALQESKPPEDLCRFSKGLLCPGSWLLGSPASQSAGSVLPQADLRLKLSLLIHFHQNPTQQHVPRRLWSWGEELRIASYTSVCSKPLSASLRHIPDNCVSETLQFYVLVSQKGDGTTDFLRHVHLKRDIIYFFKWITDIYVLCFCNYDFFRE